MNAETRKWFALCRTAGVLGVVTAVTLALRAAGGLRIFLSVRQLAFTFGLTFFILMASFGVEFIGFIPHAMLVLLGRRVQPSTTYARIAAFGSRYVIGAGAIGTLIGLAQALMSMTSLERLPGGILTATMPMFYAIVASEIVFALLHASFTEADGKPTAPLPLTNIGLAVALLVSIAMAALVLCLAFS